MAHRVLLQWHWPFECSCYCYFGRSFLNLQGVAGSRVLPPRLTATLTQPLLSINPSQALPGPAGRGQQGDAAHLAVAAALLRVHLQHPVRPGGLTQKNKKTSIVLPLRRGLRAAFYEYTSSTLTDLMGCGCSCCECAGGRAGFVHQSDRGPG